MIYSYRSLNMKKKVTKVVITLFAALTLCSVFTACIFFFGNRESLDVVGTWYKHEKSQGTQLGIDLDSLDVVLDFKADGHYSEMFPYTDASSKNTYTTDKDTITSYYNGNKMGTIYATIDGNVMTITKVEGLIFVKEGICYRR
jgi:hypothetical protein